MYRLKNMSTWKAWTTEEEAEPDGTSAQCPPPVPCPFYPDLPWPPQITALIPRPVAASTWLSNLPSPKLPDRPLTYLVSTTMWRPTMARLMSMGLSRQYLHQLPNDRVLFQPRPKIIFWVFQQIQTKETREQHFSSFYVILILLNQQNTLSLLLLYYITVEVHANLYLTHVSLFSFFSSVLHAAKLLLQ